MQRDPWIDDLHCLFPFFTSAFYMVPKRGGGGASKIINCQPPTDAIGACVTNYNFCNKLIHVYKIRSSFWFYLQESSLA